MLYVKWGEKKTIIVKMEQGNTPIQIVSIAQGLLL
jgi:hypothetical protein